mmetsp:Transcript_3740/g.6371  ORF Transcript_3740/g.6371 Transcript_3740/m.6371 type:complete len:130 (+) Transcript_3740:122-511(+)
MEGGSKTPHFYFNFASRNIPHFDKRHKGGEDAWVAQENLMVVADGVGGWASEGVDSGLFSKQLVKDIQSMFNESPSLDLKTLLIESVKKNENMGSSTCVLLKFDTERPDFIKTTNLGDSGYLIFRPDPA